MVRSHYGYRHYGYGDIGITDIDIAGGVMAIATATGKCYYPPAVVFGGWFDGPNRLAAIAPPDQYA